MSIPRKILFLCVRAQPFLRKTLHSVAKPAWRCVDGNVATIRPRLGVAFLRDIDSQARTQRTTVTAASQTPRAAPFALVFLRSSGSKFADQLWDCGKNADLAALAFGSDRRSPARHRDDGDEDGESDNTRNSAGALLAGGLAIVAVEGVSDEDAVNKATQMQDSSRADTPASCSSTPPPPLAAASRTPSTENSPTLSYASSSPQYPRSTEDEASSPEEELLRWTNLDRGTVAELLLHFESKCGDGWIVLRQRDLQTTDHWKALAVWLTHRPAIVSLRIEDVAIDAARANILFSPRRLQHLCHISLCGASLGIDPDPKRPCLDKLIKALIHCPKLDTVTLDRNSFSDRDGEDLGLLIQEHRNISKLSLAWNGLGDTSALCLARGMRAGLKKTSLEDANRPFHLGLGYNMISARGCSELLKCVNEAARVTVAVDAYVSPKAVVERSKQRSCATQARRFNGYNANEFIGAVSTY